MKTIDYASLSDKRQLRLSIAGAIFDLTDGGDSPQGAVIADIAARLQLAEADLMTALYRLADDGIVSSGPAVNEARLTRHGRECVEKELAQISSLRPVGWNPLPPAPAEQPDDAVSRGARTAPAAVEATDLDRIQDLERVADGSEGRVYRGQDTRLARVVAVKILHEDSQDTTPLEQARRLAAVHHDNVVHVIDVMMVRHPTSGLPVQAIVMNFIEGETLQSRLMRQVSVAEAQQLGSGVIAGIRAFHAVGRCHADIHGYQVLVNRDGVPKIIDPRNTRSVMAMSTAPLKSMQDRDARDARSLLAEILDRVDLYRGDFFRGRFSADAPSLDNLVDELRLALSPNVGSAIAVVDDADPAVAPFVARLARGGPPREPLRRGLVRVVRELDVGELRALLVLMDKLSSVTMSPGVVKMEMHRVIEDGIEVVRVAHPALISEMHNFRGYEVLGHVPSLPRLFHLLKQHELGRDVAMRFADSLTGPSVIEFEVGVPARAVDMLRLAEVP